MSLFDFSFSGAVFHWRMTPFDGSMVMKYGRRITCDSMLARVRPTQTSFIISLNVYWAYRVFADRRGFMIMGLSHDALSLHYTQR